MSLATLFRRGPQASHKPSITAQRRTARRLADIPDTRPTPDDEPAESLTWLVSSLDLRRGLDMTELPDWPADWPGALPANAPRQAGPLAAVR